MCLLQAVPKRVRVQMFWAGLKSCDKYVFNVLENLRTFWEHNKYKTFAPWHFNEYKQEVTSARHNHCFSQNKKKEKKTCMFFIILSLNYVLFTAAILSLWLYSLGAGFLS